MAEPPPTWRARAILHVDMDAFFASVEQLDNPEWRGRPVIVGGAPGGRGVVSAASYEARAFGVRSAMPSSRAARLCPDAVWARPRFDRYRELSDEVHDIFRSVTPRVQQVSIDEAYLDVTPGAYSETDPVALAREIQERVDALGLSCSIGIGTSRTVAKIASDRDKPHGITVVGPGREAAFLADLPATLLPGIGAATAERLRDVGIHTLGDLARLDAASAARLLGSGGPDLVARAAGIDPRAVVADDTIKSVSNEHTFAQDVRERADVERALRQLIARVAVRLRHKGLAARTLTVKLRYADFTTKTASRTLGVHTDLEDDLLPVALDVLHHAWTPGAGLRLLGFGVSNFGEPTRQLELLAEAPEEGHARARSLAESIDAVRGRFGDDAIVFGHNHSRTDGEDE